MGDTEMKNKNNKIQNGLELAKKDLGNIGGGYTMEWMKNSLDPASKYYQVINEKGEVVDEVNTLEEANKRNEELELSKKIITINGLNYLKGRAEIEENY